MEGVDYSSARPSPLCLWSNGKRFVARYFGPGSSGKHATAVEVRAHLAVGLSVVALAEGFERDPLSGVDMGKRHATSAANAMHQAGIPSDRPVYFAVDFDASVAQLHVVQQYLSGCATEIGWQRVGVYAGYNQIKWIAANNPVGWFFQTYAWSGGKWFFGNNMEQYRNGVTVCGGRVDLCRSKRTDFGQHPAPRTTGGAPPPPPPDSTVTTPWEYTDHVQSLSDTFGRVASTMDGLAGQIERLVQ